MDQRRFDPSRTEDTGAGAQYSFPSAIFISGMSEDGSLKRDRRSPGVSSTRSIRLTASFFYGAARLTAVAVAPLSIMLPDQKTNVVGFAFL